MCFTFSVHPTSEVSCFSRMGKRRMFEQPLLLLFAGGFSLLKRLVTPVSSKSVPETL